MSLYQSLRKGGGGGGGWGRFSLMFVYNVKHSTSTFKSTAKEIDEINPLNGTKDKILDAINL